MRELIPTLAELAADPDRVEDVAPEAVPRLLSDVEAIRARLWGRLMRGDPSVGNGAEETPEEPDRLLTVDELAEVLSVEHRWIYDHHQEWPFTRRIADRTLRFSERGLRRWLATRR